MSDLVCRKGLILRVQTSGMCGYSIGTIVEEGEDQGMPNCRCSGYYKTKELAQKALDSRTFNRMCPENVFCNGGMGCLVITQQEQGDTAMTADNEWHIDELMDILYSECKRQCSTVKFLLDDMTNAIPQVVADKFADEFDLIDKYNELGGFEAFDYWLGLAISEWLFKHKSPLYV